MPPTLPKHSAEQKYVLDSLSNNNVIVDSVAGSGKTTCNLHIATHYKTFRLLLLTYNSRLKMETRQKVADLEIKNLETHSYHSFCVKYYDRGSITDAGIKNIINDDTIPLKKFAYDMILLDEAQDISIVYYELVCKIMKDNMKKNIKMCVLGDVNQSIFDFNGADSRYIKYADKLYTFNQFPWMQCKLTTSYRITKEMSIFINQCMMGYDRILSKKTTNIKPRYIICDTFGALSPNKNRTFLEIEHYLNMNYKPGEIFILAPSLRNSKSSVRVLENLIKTRLPHIQVFVPTNDDETLDSDVIENKIVFSTFHQTKGLERKVVLIFGFDDSYFRYYKKDVDPNICPNELYVATTRAIEHLSIFHHYQNDYLPFIKKNKLNHCCDVTKYVDLRIPKNRDNKNTVDICPTELVRHIPEHVLDKCFEYFDFDVVRDESSHIKIPSKIKGQGYCENVSEITGIAIPTFFEFKIKNKMAIYDRINDKLERDIDINNMDTEQLLYIANHWNTQKTGYIFKLHQIKKYDWLSHKNLEKSMRRLESLNISKNSLFEHKLEIVGQKELYGRRLIGFLDCFDNENNTVYEFKCTNSIEKDHHVQLAIYMYMNELEKKMRKNRLISDNEMNKQNAIQKEIEDIINQPLNSINIDIDMIIGSVNSSIDFELERKLKDIEKETKYVLYNVLTDEYIGLKSDLERLTKMIDYIVYSKYHSKNVLPDEKFLKINENVLKRYFYSGKST